MNVLNWQELLLPRRQTDSERQGKEKALIKKQINEMNDIDDTMTSDYHRILLSASFRRLQDKTQVFPLDNSDFVRTRLTHSLEVSSLAKHLGQVTGKKLATAYPEQAPTVEQQNMINDLLLCAGLVHDIGNPPFGHYGETTIRLWFKNNLSKLYFFNQSLDAVLNVEMYEDLLNFEGNAQTLRVLNKLHFAANGYGLNLLYSLLHIIIKYPVPSTEIKPTAKNVEQHKLGYFWSEKKLFQDITACLGTAESVRLHKHKFAIDGQVLFADQDKQITFFPDIAAAKSCRHPLTFLLEAADDITYRTADIEDAYKKNKFDMDLLCKELNKFPKTAAKGEYSESTLAEYKNLIGKLKTLRNKAERQQLPEADLYALQTWLAFLQETLVTVVADEFCRNYQAIMNAEYHTEIVKGTVAEIILAALGHVAYKYVFHSRQIIKLELAANSIIGGLLDMFIPACIYFDTKEKLNPVQQRLMDIISDNYLQCYRKYSKGLAENEKLYLRLLLVTDYISGMTDGFAKNLHEQLRG